LTPIHWRERKGIVKPVVHSPAFFGQSSMHLAASARKTRLRKIQVVESSALLPID
jgi:hypothetical protein